MAIRRKAENETMDYLLKDYARNPLILDNGIPEDSDIAVLGRMPGHDAHSYVIDEYEESAQIDDDFWQRVNHDEPYLRDVSDEPGRLSDRFRTTEVDVLEIDEMQEVTYRQFECLVSFGSKECHCTQGQIYSSNVLETGVVSFLNDNGFMDFDPEDFERILMTWTGIMQEI